MLAGAASAEEACRLPHHIPKTKLQQIDCKNNISPDSYALALSWSPQHCANVDAHSPKHHFQCALNNFGFVVHGLWGQHSRARGKCAQPRHCAASLVSEDTVRKTLCTVPGVELIQAQWQKHGSCTGLSQAPYFEKTRALAAALTKPDIVRLADARDETTAGAIVQAFVAANRHNGLFAEAVAVRVGHRNAFQEVLVCYNLQFQYAACALGKTPAQQRVRVARPRGA